jgi:hypothetical protein
MTKEIIQRFVRARMNFERSPTADTVVEYLKEAVKMFLYDHLREDEFVTAVKQVKIAKAVKDAKEHQKQ